jgi:hypothetical protein
MTRGRPIPLVHVFDEVTVGLVVPGDCTPAGLRLLERRVAAAAVRPRCLVVDMSRGPAAAPELAHAVAGVIERARDRGLGVAIVSPGAEVMRAIAAAGVSGAVDLVPTVDEALARVRGRLTPDRTIRVLAERRAA